MPQHRPELGNARCCCCAWEERADLKDSTLTTFRCKNDGCSIVSCARDHARSAGMIGGAGEGMLVVRMA